MRRARFCPRRPLTGPCAPPRKEDADCCLARALPDGRPVIGFCGPDCIRRPEVWERMR